MKRVIAQVYAGWLRLLAALSIACLSGSLYAGEAQVPPVQTDTPAEVAVDPRLAAAELLPAKARIALVVPDLSALVRCATQSHLAQVFSTPEMHVFLRPVLRQMGTAWDNLRKRRPDLPALEALESGLATAQVVAASYRREDDGQGAHGMLVTIKPKDPQLFARLFPSLLGLGPLPDRKALDLEPYGGAITWSDGQLTYCRPAKDLGAMVSRLADPKVRSASSMAQSETFRCLSAQLPQAQALLAIDVKSLFQDLLVGLEGARRTAALDRMAQVGFDDLQGLAFGLGAKSGSPVLEGFLLRADGKRAHPILDPVIGLGVSSRALSRADRGAPYASAVHVDWMGLLALVRIFMAGIHPDMVKVMAGKMNEFRESFGFELESDFLANLEPEVTVYQTEVDTSAPPFLTPGLVLTVRAKDRKKVAACVEKIFGKIERDSAAGKESEEQAVRRYEHLGHLLYYIPLPTYGRLVVGVLEDRVVIATTLSAARRAVEQSAAKTSLLEDEDFRATIARVTGRPFDSDALPGVLIYERDRGTGSTEFLVSALGIWMGTAMLCACGEYPSDPKQLAQTDAPLDLAGSAFEWFLGTGNGRILKEVYRSIDLGLWPDKAFFEKYRRSKGAAVERRPDGVYMCWELPLPLPSAGTGPGVMTVAGALGVGMVAALPTFTKARRQFDGLRNVANLRAIGRALDAYAKDSATKGRFPDEIEELFPRYLTDHALFISPVRGDQPVCYVYVAGVRPDQADYVVLYEAVALEQTEGRTVLFASGKVDWVSHQAFDDAMKRMESGQEKERQALKLQPVYHERLEKLQRSNTVKSWPIRPGQGKDE